MTGGAGCPKCADPALSQEEWDQRASAVGLEWQEEVRGADIHAKARCKDCGFEWKVRPSLVNNGSSCPKCADYGFDSSAPSIVYQMIRDNETIKVGIANESSNRVAKHKRRGFETVEIWHVSTGIEARDIESSVLRWWRSTLGAPPAIADIDGWTETVSTSAVSVPDAVRFIRQQMK